MARRERREWTDAEMLDVLAERAAGVSSTVIARRYGVTRAAILGLVHRVTREAERDFPPCDQDGTLAPDWWEAGLSARKVAA